MKLTFCTFFRLTYSKMEIYDEAINCYKKALELDPDNEGYKKNLTIAEEKQRLQQVVSEVMFQELITKFSAVNVCIFNSYLQAW